MPSSPKPKLCNRPGCLVPITLARHQPGGQWVAYEAQDREPFSIAAVTADVLIGTQSWRPADLVEDYMVRHELTETAAREVVSGFPFHRPHHHLKEN